MSHPATSHPATSHPATSHPATSLPATSHPATSLPATSHPANIAPAVLDTILRRLAALFVTAASPTAARDAASRTLATYNVADEQELGLAADIIAFALHALEALGQAANPDLSLTKILRLRGSAVSLSRESHKARRKLDQLQRARSADADQPATERQSKSIAPHREAQASTAPARAPRIAAVQAQETLLPGAPPPEAQPGPHRKPPHRKPPYCRPRRRPRPPSRRPTPARLRPLSRRANPKP